MKKWAQLTKKQKWVIVAISAGLLCGGIFGGYQAYAAHQQTSERLALEEKLSVLDTNGELAKAIDSLEDSAGYLSAGITHEEIEQIQEQLDTLAEETNTYEKHYGGKAPKTMIKELTAIDIQQGNLDRIQKKFTLQGKVNDLFQGKDLAIDGSEVSKDVIIADGTTSQIIEGLALSEQPFEEDKWLESITDLVSEANAQLEGITKADKAVDACYKDKKVDPKVTKKNYEAAEKAVKAVKREADKERLDKKLTEVKKVVDANEKKAKEQAEKEKQEKAAQETAQNEVSSDSSSQNQASAESAGNNQSTSNGSTANNWSNGNTSSGGSSNNSNTSSGNGSGGSTTNGGSSSNNSSGNNSSNGGGNSNGSNNTSNGGGNTTPDKPYAINPYTGSGTFYATYEAARAAARANYEASGYDIITEVWSDGSEKYYLEFH